MNRYVKQYAYSPYCLFDRTTKFIERVKQINRIEINGQINILYIKIERKEFLFN